MDDGRGAVVGAIIKSLRTNVEGETGIGGIGIIIITPRRTGQLKLYHPPCQQRMRSVYVQDVSLLYVPDQNIRVDC